MKLLNAYVFAFVWAAVWFLGCGDSTSVAVNQQQANDEGANNIGPAEACTRCVNGRDEGETFSECLTRYGYDVQDC